MLHLEGGCGAYWNQISSKYKFKALKFGIAAAHLWRTIWNCEEMAAKLQLSPK